MQEVSWMQFLSLCESIAAQIQEVAWTQFLSQAMWFWYLFISSAVTKVGHLL